MHPVPSTLNEAEVHCKAQPAQPEPQQQSPSRVAEEDSGQHTGQQHQYPDAGPLDRRAEDYYYAPDTTPAPSPRPARKDTASSIASSTATDATAATNASTDTNATSFSSGVESSQSIFPANDGVDVPGSSSNASSRGRRRTGPLTAAQREKAALIRKLGACKDCRRRRVACHPNHHKMSWADAVRKCRSRSPTQAGCLSPLASHPISPASDGTSTGRAFTQDPQEMHVDPSPTTPGPQTSPARAPMPGIRLRTPLPSGPLDKPMPVPRPPPWCTTTLPPMKTLPHTGGGSIKSDLETAASRVFSNTQLRGRYSAVSALLVTWRDDQDAGVRSAVGELNETLERCYHFKTAFLTIPPASSDGGCKSSARWLAREINEFIDDGDARDVLKIVYYNGSTYLDGNREMVLASPRDLERASTIRWRGIQHILEEACSDTLVIFDAVYFPLSRLVRQKGVLELVAASASEEQYHFLGRNSMTRALNEHLRTSLDVAGALSTAQFHARLLSIYRRRNSGSWNAAASMPVPLYVQVSGNPKLPSITLSPLPPPPRPRGPPPLFGAEALRGPQISLSISLKNENPSIENWLEWLRMMPDEMKDIRVEGPFRTLK